MAENVKLRKRNFTTYQGYFYMIDEDQDNLLSKTDDGNTAFSYPLDTLISKEIVSLEYDGVYLWSLEEGASAGNDVTIRRWQIDNYICKLQETFTFILSGSHRYDAEAFSIEHYHTTFSQDATASSSIIYLDDYWNGTTISGSTLHLGPNSNNEEEDVVVTTTVSGGVNLSSPTTYDYLTGDDVNYHKYIWLFNDYDGVDGSTGALYKFDSHDATPASPTVITKYPGGAYKSVQAATFYKVNSFTEYGDVDTLCYIKGTNLLFINAGAAGVTLPYYGSMVMSNIEVDEATVFPVYDLAMDDQNVYRLQKGADGSGGETWTYYSYELSSLDSFVTSISLAAYPAIIAANLVSTTDIIAIVKDQFLQPVISRLVQFTDDDANGIISGTNPATTNSDGQATTIYRSGDEAREVKITATVEQT